MREREDGGGAGPALPAQGGAAPHVLAVRGGSGECSGKGGTAMRWVAALGVPALLSGAALMADQQQAPDPFRDAAGRYVRLLLAVGQHDGDYVDAYYGPPEWRTQAEAQQIPLPEIAETRRTLVEDPRFVTPATS